MNEELLSENALLMKKIHDCKEKEKSDAHELNLATEIENEQMRKCLESNCQELNGLREAMKVADAKIQEMEQERKSLQKELEQRKKLNAVLKIKNLQINVKNNALMRRLTSLQSQVDDKSSHECCAEPKLKQINQGVEHLLSAMEKLSSSKDEQAVVPEVEDLKHRLHLARNEYEKLHAVMINYRTKYNDLKRKYQQKIVEQNHPFST